MTNDKEIPSCWINPNDKTKDRFLPNIGERVLFCIAEKVYIGRHTGGSFRSEAPPFTHFGTWNCRWMPLPVPVSAAEIGRGM